MALDSTFSKIALTKLSLISIIFAIVYGHQFSNNFEFLKLTHGKCPSFSLLKNNVSKSFSETWEKLESITILWMTSNHCLLMADSV